MQISILPKSYLGRWSVGLVAACIVLLVLLVVLVGGVGFGVVKPGSLGAWMLGSAWCISDIAALVTGLISIIKTKERSILVFLAVFLAGVIGVFCLILFVGEELLGC